MLLTLVLLLAGTAVARQTPDLLTPLPLDDLSAFAPTDSTNWVIVGDAWASWTEDRSMETRPGTGVLANVEIENGRGANLFTAWEHGDLELELEFMMPRSSNSGIYLQGRYEIQLLDSWGADPPRHADAGGIYQRWDESRPEGERGFEGHPPAVNVSRAPGLWQHFRIVFRAPRFDATGEKTENARFLEVWHNGVLVHEDIELTGPTRAAAFEDEAPEGPLMFQGDHGPVAFRDIRYRRLISERVELADLRYAYYEGDWSSLPDLSTVEPRTAEATDALTWAPLQTRDGFVLAYEGTLNVPVTDTYTFHLTLHGAARLFVDGRSVLRFDGPEERNDIRFMHVETGSIDLPAGSHPFRLVYYKLDTPWLGPGLYLDAESPVMPRHALSSEPENYGDDAPPPMPVEIGDRPYPFRSFVLFDGVKRTHAMLVGDPSGAHYAIDLDGMALLYLWKGGFLDALPMWHQRGNRQAPDMIGSVITLSGLPTVAALEGPSTPWPDSLDAFTFDGYTLDDDGYPTFHYSVDGVDVADRIRPQEEGRYLRRTLEFAADADRTDLRVLLARSSGEIEDWGAGNYTIGDGEYLIFEDPDVIDVDTRTDDALLSVPVRFENGRATVTYDLIW